MLKPGLPKQYFEIMVPEMRIYLFYRPKTSEILARYNGF